MLNQTKAAETTRRTRGAFSEAEQNKMIELWLDQNPYESMNERAVRVGWQIGRSASAVKKRISAWMKTDQGQTEMQKLLEMWDGLDASIRTEEDIQIEESWNMWEGAVPEQARVLKIAWRLHISPSRVRSRLRSMKLLEASYV